MEVPKYCFIAVDKLTNKIAIENYCVVSADTYEGCQTLLEFVLQKLNRPQFIDRFEIKEFVGEYVEVPDPITESTAIEDCRGLDTRIENCCKAENINTVGDLLKKRRKDFMKMPNFGKKSLEKLLEFLKEHGFKLQG
jgi:DNA-directed RNA polymerase alpha subunit